MPANPEHYLGIRFFDQLVGSHRQWLEHFDKQYLRSWDNLFTRDNSEAALCEAATRQLLEELEVDVEPYALGSSDRNPDFKCSKNGRLFYVDATCVTKDTATRRSRLPDTPDGHGSQFYSLLTESYFRKADSKETQFEKLGAPCLIAIGTFHFQAGAHCFDEGSAEEILTGTTSIRGRINTTTGASVGDPYNATSLQAAPFLRARRIICPGPVVEPVRQTISGVLLCPFGAPPVKILGILHPHPHHEFERELLSRIPFCRLKPGWEDGVFCLEWM